MEFLIEWKLPSVSLKHEDDLEELQEKDIPDSLYPLLALEMLNCNYGISRNTGFIHIMDFGSKSSYLSLIVRILKKPEHLLQINKLIKQLERLEFDDLARNKLFEKITSVSVRYNGVLHSSIFGGVSLIDGKTHLKEFIRKGDVDRALSVAFEIFKFRSFSSGSLIISNLKRHLMAFCVEDIGPANVPLVSEVLDTCLNDDLSPNNLFKMISEMTRSLKTNIVGDISKIYNCKVSRECNKLGFKVDIESRKTDWEIIDSDELWYEGDPEKIRPYLNIMLERVREGDRNAFGWADVYFRKCENLKVKKRRNRTRAEVVFWHALDIISCPKNDRAYKKILILLENAFFNSTEGSCFWKLALFLALDGVAKPCKVSENSEDKNILHYMYGKYGLISLPSNCRLENEDPRFGDRNIKRAIKILK